MEGPPRVWYNSRRRDERGVAAPVQRLLAALADTGSLLNTFMQE